jgi:hypothetical protein
MLSKIKELYRVLLIMIIDYDYKGKVKLYLAVNRLQIKFLLICELFFQIPILY